MESDQAEADGNGHYYSVRGDRWLSLLCLYLAFCVKTATGKEPTDRKIIFLIQEIIRVNKIFNKDIFVN